MPLFFIGILLIFFDLSFKKKPIVHLTGFIIYGFILLIFYGILFISDFTYDIPVSFFGFLAFYVTQKEDKPGFHIKTVLLVIIFAISAANIKLAGIFVVGLSFLWILYYIYINKKNISKKKLLRVIGYITLILASGFSWYIFMPAQMAEGVGSSPFKPYNGLYESFMYGIKMLFYSFGSLFSIFILITLISALLTKTKHIVLLVIAPLFIVWAFWYSYDCRNLSVAIPFVAYSSAYGLEFIYGIIRKRFNYLNLSLINNSNTFLLDLMDNNWKLSILFILLLFIFFVVVRTNIFFNFVINLAYFFWRFYFQYNKSVFVIELGYYKDVIYFVDTIKVLILLILALFILRKSRIKIKHLIIFILISLTCLNFTLLKKENILKRQNYDKEMVHLHNVYFKIHPYINNSEFEKSIITNSSLFSELIFPRGIKVEYVPNIKQEIINNLKNKNVKNILLEKNKLRKGEIDKIYKVLDKNYNVYFNNDGFIFFTKS